MVCDRRPMSKRAYKPRIRDEGYKGERKAA
jgi:hypothetical protein